MSSFPCLPLLLFVCRAFLQRPALWQVDRTHLAMGVEGNLFLRPLRIMHTRLKQRPFLILISKWEGKRLELFPSGLSPLMLQVAWSLVGITVS
jgi:hypothetical protein